ncbi:TlpA family protein disulfide reductase [Streptomyces flavofungini]|uniref:TlpA family protein disulfide reductase n=1 Tax=Streptomyces flavofungini TaxID=68200 RepID=UPI0025AEF650|nr:TlpA disulfide reductase family protein [Streptomyces flavofungini]WJV46959.1 TlpA disulfide reductase family protein [Streptomyces flavofungini]
MSAAFCAPRSPNRSLRSRRRAPLLAAGAAVAALALSACGSGGTSGGSGQTNFVTGKEGISTVKRGDRHDAPKIDGNTLEGEKLDVDDYKGKVVVLNVWGSWCAPCRVETPNFVKVANDTKGKDIQFIGINARDPQKGPAIAFEKDYNVPYPSLHDPMGKLMLRFPKGTLNPVLIPATVVLDKNGKLAARSQQALSEAKLRKMIDPLLAEK